MTEKERNEYRERMRSAKTQQEREKIRSEHHDRMLVRAKERGVTIPDQPPQKAPARVLAAAAERVAVRDVEQRRV